MARGVHSLDSFLEFKGRSWSEVHHDELTVKCLFLKLVRTCEPNPGT